MNVLSEYQILAERHQLPLMQPGGYVANSETLEDPDQVWNRLSELRPSQGWLLFQSHQVPFTNGLVEPKPEWGVLLAAEAYGETAGASTSIALEQDGRGGWVLTRYTHAQEGDHLYDEPDQLAHTRGRPGPSKLRYRRYWRLDPELGYVQAVACFTGFV
jgi:hypothetical protein